MNVRKAVEAFLRTQPGGATASQIAEGTGAIPRSIHLSLKVMPHVYVDRWAAAKAGPYRYQWVPVYALVDTPEPASRPSRKATVEDFILEEQQ